MNDARFKIISLVFLTLFVSLIARLFYWQVIRGSDLAVSARGQYESGRVVGASRGSILASDGTWLAARGQTWTLFASLPELKDNPKKIAEKLSTFTIPETAERSELLVEIDRITDLLSKKEVVWVPIKRKVETSVKENIEALDIAGIGFDSEEARVYPEASVAAQLLGFVGKDEEGYDIGYFGLEGYYNLPLSGKEGYISGEKDALGSPIVLDDSREITAISGVNLLTHIDKRIQLMVERRLKSGIERFGAKAGSVIVMNPKNGAILAMSSFPSYDPATYFDYGNDFFKNPTISDTFEPGSIFKVLVMAAGLDAEVVEPDTKCDICDGPFKIDKYSIETWNREYHADSTMTEVLTHSDNVGMVFVAQKLGAESLYDYLDKFGIGSLSGIDLQGEGAAPLRKKSTWSIVDLATASFGQGVAVTPIQMIRAVAAIANGGVIMTPQVVDKLLGEGWDQDIEPVYGSRVISEEASEEISIMMAEAAKSGEAKWINTNGFRVAGKTGTAQIPIAGHYDEDKTIASFVGFAPYDDPRFVMLVTLNETTSSPWASETAAPLWYGIASDLFVYFGVQPKN